MATIYHQLWIAASLPRVYEALATADGVSSWWSPARVTESVNGLVISFEPGPEHGILEARLDLIPTSQVEWTFFSEHPDTSPASAWTGTKAVFGLDEREAPTFLGSGKRTVVEFRHAGWDETSPFFGFCNFGWGEALAKLKLVCEGNEVFVPVSEV